MTPTTAPGALPAPSRRALTGTLIAGCVAVLVAQLGLVLPAAINGLMQQTLHTTGSQLTWITAAFMLPTAILELTFGVVGDLFGRKRILLGGAAFMVAGGALSSTAHTVHVLWAGQALAGIGAAALFPTSLAMVAAFTPTARSRARGLALWTASLSAGAVASPVISGWAGEHGSFRTPFGILAVLALVSGLISLWLAADSSSPRGRALDWPGQISIALSLFALLYAVIQGTADGFGSADVVTGFVIAAALFAAFLRIESRAASPMLHLNLFRVPAFSAAAVVALVGMMGFLGFAYTLSIRLGAIQHQSPLRSAIPFVVMHGITPVFGIGLAALLRRISPRILLVVGFAAMAAGQFWLAALPITDTSLTTLLGVLILVGVGFGLAVGGLTAAAVNVVPLRLAGMASATTSLMREAGQTLGPAIISAVALGQSAAVLGGRLASAGLPPAALGAANAVAKEGGPLAVASVPFGPAEPKILPVVQSALAHGFGIGLVVCGCASLVSLLVAGFFIRMRGGALETGDGAVQHESDAANPVAAAG
ncbi:MFS transporter [Actinocrinis puniceicyclus]|uniref:MFS transporter n=1 Tax=Actinocrinis puniceicyclus TaxID=977794 RepID=A0A8J8BES0_9ACTN|nr:MFS transporter [Actinocrinis puniceicyclus]MBS2965860.1 MFS transporter [Actinocrinis puniceicyclus]